MASFDGGFGSAYLARQVGQKRAREIFFLGAEYSAQEAYEMGMVNRVVPHDRLERVAYDWAREIMSKSPTAIKMLKFGFNLIDTHVEFKTSLIIPYVWGSVRCVATGTVIEFK